MMAHLQTTKTVYTASQFIDWQRAGTLNLQPIFQRRHVWKAPAKSQFIDSILRGFPIPIILLRQVQDLQTLQIKLEVVDGQQRLRTMLAFVSPDALTDYDESVDPFTVRPIHNDNKAVAGKRFIEYPDDIKQQLLAYEFSTHVFPATTGDEDIFRIFARLNSTGLTLNQQEIRNAEFHGAFKSLVYDLGLGFLDFWRKNRIFPDARISRMDEAEAVSEYLILMLSGHLAKRQPTIKKYYTEHEESLPNSTELRRRFEVVIRALEERVSDVLPTTRFHRPALFYSLFGVAYDHMFGLGRKMSTRLSAAALPAALADRLQEADAHISAKSLDEKTQDAMESATGNKDRRDKRHKYLMKALKLDSAR